MQRTEWVTAQDVSVSFAEHTDTDTDGESSSGPALLLNFFGDFVVAIEGSPQDILRLLQEATLALALPLATHDDDLPDGYAPCVNGCGGTANPSSDECFECRHRPFGTEWGRDERQRLGIDPD